MANATNATSGAEVEEAVTVVAAAVDEAEQIASFDELMDVDDLGEVYIALPAPWKGGVRARPLTMEEAYQVRKDARRKVRDGQGRVVSEEIDPRALYKAVIQKCLTEPRLDAAKVDAIFTKNARLGGALVQAMDKLNGFGEQGAAEATQEAEEAFQG